MNASRDRFGRLAALYRPLEFLALGRDLERTRFTLLPHLRACARILVLGDGDGRCLARLARLAPTARIDCLDLSPGMLAHAQRRVAAAGDRITFQVGDIRTAPLPARTYDAVVTCFFLDCFDAPEAAVVVGRIAAALRPGARWLWADFVLPPRGPARWRARLWLAVLYGFFRWQTGITARALPDSEGLIAGAGFHCVAQHTRQWGLLRTAVYRATAA